MHDRRLVFYLVAFFDDIFMTSLRRGLLIIILIPAGCVVDFFFIINLQRAWRGKGGRSSRKHFRLH